MRFEETPIAGAFLIRIEPKLDARGFFARVWCREEFAAHGLHADLVQCSISRSEVRGTVRGMHVQLPPSRESKLVRCTAGAIYDVIVDLRPESPTFLQSLGIELSARDHSALYVPPQVAHGLQTLADATEVFYQMSDVHAPHLAVGFPWDDPLFAIDWPIRHGISILHRDAGYPRFELKSYLEKLQRIAAAKRVSAQALHA